MKKTLYTPLLTAALLLAASCANDPVEEVLNPSAPGTHLPGDTFIIDYAASTGEADTRADANQRIQSLDYLVYQSTDGGTTYTLLKRRAIPDINTSTRWPLTRETMTWAQREALKDTLNTSCMYKMVFVANAADWIWEKENATPPSNDALENSSDKVLLNANLPTDGTEAPKFEDGRLILPPRVFEGNDMYYMETVEVDGKNYTGEKTAYMNVLLKRMINKVEVKLDTDEIPTNETELNAMITEKVNTYYESMKLEERIKSALIQLADGLTTGDAYDVTYREAIDKIKTCIKSEVFITGILNTEFASFPLIFKENLEALYKKQCYWQAASIIKIEYNDNAYPYAIDFTKKSYPATETDPLSYSLENNSFTYYSFGNNTAGDELNKVRNYQFINGEDLIFSIPGQDLPSNQKQGGNNHLSFLCNPIGKINDSTTKTYELTSFSIVDKYETINNCTWGDEHFGFKYVWPNANDMENKLDENSGYKTANEYWKASTLRNIQPIIDYPVITVSPTWTTIQ